MIKLYCGENTYDSYLTLKQHAKASAAEKAAEIKIINGDDSESIDEILIHLDGVGMFSSEPIVVVKRIFKNKKILEYFDSNFEKLNMYEIYLWNDDKVDNRLAFIKKIKKSGVLQNFELPKPWQMMDWTKKFADSKGIKLNRDQLEYITQRITESKWLIVNEIYKISMYLKKKENKQVTDKELREIIGTEAKGDIWKFLDLFAENKTKQIFEETNKFITYEESIQYLIAMLQREINLLAKIRDTQENGLNPKDLNLHPFVLQNNIKKVKNFSWEKLRKLSRLLLDLDFSIKKGEIKDTLGFKLFLFKALNAN